MNSRTTQGPSQCLSSVCPSVSHSHSLSLRGDCALSVVCYSFSNRLLFLTLVVHLNSFLCTVKPPHPFSLSARLESSHGVCSILHQLETKQSHMGFLHIFLIFIWKMRDGTLKRYSLSLS